MPGQENKQLTQEIVGPTSKRSIVLTLLGTVIVVALINLVFVFQSMNLGYRVIKQKWEMLLDLKQPVDWIVLGDSSGSEGVTPDIISQELGGKALNLCTIGNMLVVNDAWMLDKYIAKFGPPRGVVMVHVYDIWDRDINADILGNIPLRAGNLATLGTTGPLSLKGRLRGYLTRFFPLYSQSQTISMVLMRPWRAKAATSTGIQPDGFQSVPDANPEEVEVDTQEHLHSVHNSRFKGISRPNQEALAYINALAERYQFDIYLANGPLYEGLYRHKEFRDYYTQVTGQIDAASAKRQRMYYLLRQPMTFPRDDMQNVDHLIAPAARRFTRRLVAEIKNLQAQKKETRLSWIAATGQPLCQDAPTSWRKK